MYYSRIPPQPQPIFIHKFHLFRIFFRCSISLSFLHWPAISLPRLQPAIPLPLLRPVISLPLLRPAIPLPLLLRPAIPRPSCFGLPYPCPSCFGLPYPLPLLWPAICVLPSTAFHLQTGRTKNLPPAAHDLQQTAIFPSPNESDSNPNQPSITHTPAVPAATWTGSEHRRQGAAQ